MFVLGPDLVASFKRVRRQCAPDGVLPCNRLSNGMKLLHHPRQHHPRLTCVPPPDRGYGLLTHHFFYLLQPWASVGRPGP